MYRFRTNLIKLFQQIAFDKSILFIIFLKKIIKFIIIFQELIDFAKLVFT
jgi:hypothetical protein